MDVGCWYGIVEYGCSMKRMMGEKLFPLFVKLE